MMEQKKVIYQVFTRLFGNRINTNKPWGTLEENGVGKFADFTEKALQEIKALGVSHIWFTGVLHHAMVADYTAFGISNDDPDIVKGRAGSPYAIKDYYSVDPDLATNPANRLDEFEQLIERTHAAGLKVIIDIVPNHVARKYEGLSNPPGVKDLGADDDTSVEFNRNNNFYYIPGESFKVPQWENNYIPLGGSDPGFDYQKYEEVPAKWTGNGSRKAQPGFYDWYETVKINYGIRPDGSKDFDEIPWEYTERDCNHHTAYWEERDLPDSWLKFRDIAFFWLDKGVDGFRYDMAEMVPVEFWSFMNSSIKVKNPDALLLAEVYNPDLYRMFIHLGKMDYLYDKVSMYDSLKHIVKGYGWTDHIPKVMEETADIEHNMLHFLENHDEQRLPCSDFAGFAENGKPAMLVSATISTSPTMIYFGQETGEPAREQAGFGSPTRTSIFDYIGVPHHQRWMNNGKFDGGQLSESEKDLRDFYSRLLNFTINSEAMMGAYQEIHYFNRENTALYNHRVFSFVRWSDSEKLIIVTNFDASAVHRFELKIPEQITRMWGLQDGTYKVTDQLYGKHTDILSVTYTLGRINCELQPFSSLILKLEI